MVRLFFPLCLEYERKTRLFKAQCRTQISLFTEMQCRRKTAGVNFGGELVFKGAFATRKELVEELNSAAEVNAGNEFELLLAIPFDGGQVVGDAGENLVVVEADGVDDAFKGQWGAVGIDNLQTDLKAGKNLVGGQHADTGQADGGLFMAGMESCTTTEEEDCEKEWKDFFLHGFSFCVQGSKNLTEE